MADVPESWQTKRARYANRCRREPGGDHCEERDEVLRAWREARIAELITTAPALKPEQVDRLRHLLPPPAAPSPHPSSHPSSPSRRRSARGHEVGGDSA